KVVDEASADTILSGVVNRYVRKEQFARSDLTVTEYQVQIAVTLTLVRRATGETLFKDRRFSGTGNYLLDGSNGTSEATAREEAANEIVKDILALVVEDW
ncbi:MAG TPA: LPS assembly lipoprotein LptE, partial [Candidatus Krumholzibacteria bacterium]|nr:LPS assembly lipoprotein LptE [Candidatus Krumholzibacteria bacterium]